MLIRGIGLAAAASAGFIFVPKDMGHCIMAKEVMIFRPNSGLGEKMETMPLVETDK